MKTMKSIHSGNPASLSEQNIQPATLHVDVEKSNVVSTLKEVKRFLKQVNAKGEESSVVPLSSSPASLQTAIGVLKDLLKQKINSNKPQEYLLSAAQKDDRSEEFEHLYSYDDRNKALAFMEQHGKDIDPNYDEGILLQRATENEDVKMLSILLAKEPNTDWAFGAFEQAAYSGYEQCTEMLMKYLMKKGVDLKEIKISTAYNNHGNIKKMIDNAIASQQTSL
jgi:glutaredoxin-related protein